MGYKRELLVRTTVVGAVVLGIVAMREKETANTVCSDVKRTAMTPFPRKSIFIQRIPLLLVRRGRISKPGNRETNHENI